MKNLLLLLALGLAGYGGYLSWENHRKTMRPVVVAPEEAGVPLHPTPSPAPEPNIEPKIQPKIAVPPERPAEPAKRLAPAGVFYVVQAFSYMTESGVRSVPVGTGLKLVKDNGATFQVTDGKEQFDARREVLTDDLDAAQQALNTAKAAYGQAVAAAQGRPMVTRAEASVPAAVTPSADQNIQAAVEAARVAVAQRSERIRDLRSQIAQEEAAKDNMPSKIFGASAHQKHLNQQNEKIRQLQMELGRIGVAGAALQRN